MKLESSPIPIRTKPKNLAQGIIEHIVLRIKEGSLEIGEKLPTEADFMQTYGVSRTVIREAISHLKAAQLVETRHGIGTFVLPPTASGIGAGMQNEAVVTVRDVLDILEIRISLETESAWLAASRRTEAQIELLRTTLEQMHKGEGENNQSVSSDIQFHLQIAQATGNKYFVELLNHLGQTIIPRTRLNTAQLNDDPSTYLNRLYHEHESIFNAISRKDPEAARAAMRTHLSNSRERLLRAQEILEADSKKQ